MILNEEDIGSVLCPACGEGKLRLEERLEAKQIGTYSLAGAQMKVSAVTVVYLVCGGCGIEARGKRE